MASTNSWTGIGRQVLDQFLNSERGTGGGDAGQFGIDAFTDGFEDEFPGDSEDPIGGTYNGYSLEANRASENRPWGQPYGDRPKIHELNQPPAAQALGWRVIDFYPNRDHKSEFYRLAGTPAELRQMLQVIQATRFVTGARINFEAWFKQWELGFPNMNADRATSNFALVGESQWKRIKEPETRPRYRELTNSQQRADGGYRVIEYWRNRNNEANSVIMSGTDLLLINQIVQYEYQGGGSSASSIKQKGGDYPRLKGQPLLRLYFAEDIPHPNKSLRTGEITLRIMDKTDDPRINLEKISKADIGLYATRIRDLFGFGGGYVWDKGKMVVSYRSRYQGFEGWYLVRTKSDGQNLITKLLGITNQVFDNTKLFFSENADPVAAYPDTPTGSALILGETVALPEKRPRVSVRFQKAELELALLPNPIPLVEADRVVYNA